MKNRLYKLLNICAIASLSVVTAHAGSTLVLEGFENGFTTNSEGITNIFPFTTYGNDRGTPVSISLFTAAAPGDPRVTQGTHSIKVVFPAEGFGNDIGFAFSDPVCTLLENAASSNQIARYVLRYDVIFEHVDQLSYFNQHFFIANDWDYVRAAGAFETTWTNGVVYGVSSFSVPLELPDISMPTNPPSSDNSADFAAAGIPGLTAFIADQFATTAGGSTNYTIYLDNFRLVDTYATPGTTPTIYPLQSFEMATNPLGGATDLAPATTYLSQYVTNGQYNPATDSGIPNVDTAGWPNTLAQESDFAVTDGAHALEVLETAPGYSYDDFSLPFGSTILGQLISSNAVPTSLTNYTLRFDVTTPLVPVDPDNANVNGSDSDYINIDYNAVNGAALPMSTGRRQSDGQQGLQRETYSLTLDQIAYFPSPAAIAMSYSQPSTWTNSPFFMDNFVLINTAPPPPTISITSESYNAATRQFTITFGSTVGGTYSVKYTSDLTQAFSTALATGIPSGGTSTTTTVTVPSGNAGYLIVTSP